MNLTKETTLLLADDHPVFRRGLIDVITSRPGYRIVGEADNGEEALIRIRELRPDIAVLDIEMPVMDGVEVAKELQAAVNSTSVIMLTMHRESIYFFRALDAGVAAYVLKDSAIRDLMECIERVRDGEFYISIELRNLLLDHRLKKRQLRAERRGLDMITATERKVLQRIAEGMTTRETAASLGVSPRTVEHHRSSICRKLSLRGSNALLRFALENRFDF